MPRRAEAAAGASQRTAGTRLRVAERGRGRDPLGGGNLYVPPDPMFEMELPRTHAPDAIGRRPSPCALKQRVPDMVVSSQDLLEAYSISDHFRVATVATETRTAQGDCRTCCATLGGVCAVRSRRVSARGWTSLVTTSNLQLGHVRRPSRVFRDFGPKQVLGVLGFAPDWTFGRARGCQQIWFCPGPAVAWL